MPNPGLSRSRPMLFTMRMSHNEAAQLAGIAAAMQMDERAAVRELVRQEYLAQERKQADPKRHVPDELDAVKVALAKLDALEARAEKKPDGGRILDTQRAIPLGAPPEPKQLALVPAGPPKKKSAPPAAPAKKKPARAPKPARRKTAKKSAAERTRPLFGKKKVRRP